MWKIVFVLIYLMVLSVMDIREKQVPLYLLLVGLFLAMTTGIGEGIREEEISGEMNLIRIGWKILLGLMPGAFFLGIAWVSGKAGKGDGLVLMILGALTDYRICMIIFSVSLLLVSAFSVCMMALRRIHRKTCLPYIPFLTVAYIGYQICKGGV